MSETPKKRVNKSKDQLVDELKVKKENAFKDALCALEDEHGFRLEPILHYSVRGLIPQITMVEVEHVTLEPKKAKQEEETVV